ncbi:NAD-P-binding protein [Trametes polyzona]|nr:NAD-P-binding protein [Trametes polyzona]
MTSRIWFITGASSGFGRLLTEIILDKGENVIATARRPSALDDLAAQYPRDRLLVLKLDVTQQSEIVDAFAQAKSAFGRIDVVVNNAAYAVMGELEAVRDEDSRPMFETNFWGAAHVTREAVRFFREVNGPAVGGRLLQISSVSGVIGLPGIGLYSASKFALEGLTESVAGELDPAWNIKVTLIEPAGFHTEGPKKAVWGTPHPAYSNPALPATQMRKNFHQFEGYGDARKGAEAFYKIALVEDPPLRLPLGEHAVILTKQKAEQLLKDARLYESWSADIHTKQ